jgi:hypothetical protein
LVAINAELDTQTIALGDLYDYLGYGKDGLGNTISAEIATLFDIKHLYDTRPLQIETLTATGGTAVKNTNEPCVDMTVTGTTGSRVVRQSAYIPYQPGKIVRVICTGVMSTTAATVTAKYVKRSYITGSQVDTANTITSNLVNGVTVY